MVKLNQSLHYINLKLKKKLKGFWFKDLFNKRRWVSKGGRASYAHTTIQKARNNFIKRSEKRVRLLEEQLKRTQEGLIQVERFYKPKKKK